MKKNLTLLLSLLVFGIGCSAPMANGLQNKGPETQATPGADSAKAAEVMKGLRNKLLTSKPEEVGLSEEDAKAKVWGVLMEMGLPSGVGTLVSIRDGTASLYTNTGGGILGGYSAREEAKNFVAEAVKHLARMKPTKTFPYPAVGRVKFYLLTPGGVYTAEAAYAELVSKKHTLSPLFFAGDKVLTGLRLASERAKPDGEQ